MRAPVCAIVDAYPLRPCIIIRNNRSFSVSLKRGHADMVVNDLMQILGL